jgi:hypothetical protein
VDIAPCPTSATSSIARRITSGIAIHVTDQQTLNRIAGLIKQMTADILGPDGHVQGRVDLLCKDEEAAKERAKQLVDGHAVELWQLDQKIATFKPMQ